MPTSMFNENIKYKYCEQLGITYYTTEPYYDSGEVIKTDKELYFPFLVKWRIETKEFSAVIRPILIEVEEGSWPFKKTVKVRDLEASEKEIIRIIKQSVKEYNNGI